MIRKLVPDEKFTPCTETPGDEMYPNGIFLFNISRMLEYLQGDDSDIPIMDVRVAEFSLFSSLNEAHLDTVDLDNPVLVAEIAPQQYNLIDGNHRMEKARRNGITHLPGYRVPPDVHTRFLTSFDAYHSYINYWNGKVDEQM